GKFVAPAPMESRLMQEPAVERALVIGDERPYVVALIGPAGKFLASQGITGDREDLVGNERAQALLQEGVDRLNRDLGSWETVKYFRILPEDFSEEAGELTPTLK